LFRYTDGEGRTGLLVFRIFVCFVVWSALVLALTFLGIGRSGDIDLRVYGALFEWVCTIGLCFFWLSYYFDLRRAAVARIIVNETASEYAVNSFVAPSSYSEYSRLMYN
jgi:hypothetical protein